MWVYKKDTAKGSIFFIFLSCPRRGSERRLGPCDKLKDIENEWDKEPCKTNKSDTDRSIFQYFESFFVLFIICSCCDHIETSSEKHDQNDQTKETKSIVDNVFHNVDDTITLISTRISSNIYSSCCISITNTKSCWNSTSCWRRIICWHSHRIDQSKRHHHQTKES